MISNEVISLVALPPKTIRNCEEYVANNTEVIISFSQSGVWEALLIIPKANRNGEAAHIAKKRIYKAAVKESLRPPPDFAKKVPYDAMNIAARDNLKYFVFITPDSNTLPPNSEVKAALHI